MIKRHKYSHYLLFACGALIMFLPFKTTSQNKFTDDLTITPNYHFGYILPEYSSFVYWVNDNVKAVSIDIAKKTRGKNEWEHVYKFPEFGISFFYSSLGNNTIFGNEIAVNPFFRINLITKEKFRLYNQSGVGIDYVNKKFDLENNYYNIAVGSKVNLHFNMRFGAGYAIAKKINLNAGISFDHFSNGNTDEPNIGINSFTYYGGIGYLLGSEREYRILELQPHVKKNHWNIFGSFGGKHARALDTKYYFTSSASLEFAREFTRVVQLGLGMDAFYDSSTEVEMAAYSTTAHQNIYDYRAGIHFSQALVYNKLSLELQEGIYLLLTDKVSGKTMYNRGIISYKLNDHFIVRIAMKSHLYILDYPELGIGYRLK